MGLALWAMLALAIPAASGYPFVYQEDFTTTTFKDPQRTTAIWDAAAGELRLAPFQAMLVGTAATPAPVRRILLAGDRAYLAQPGHGLTLFDVTDPSAPLPGASERTYASVNALALSGTRVYEAMGTPAGLGVVDVSNPATPVPVGFTPFAGEGLDVVLSGHYAFVAAGESGLVVLDVSVTPPRLAAGLDTDGMALAIDVDGGLACIADWVGGVDLIDIRDPEAPLLLGQATTLGLVRDVVLRGDQALVGGNAGLHVLDVTDPALPATLGTLNVGSTVEGIAAAGDYAYLACGFGGLAAVDLSSIAHPALLGWFASPGFCSDLVLAGEQAFIAAGGGGLVVARVANPRAPALAGGCRTPGQARAFAFVPGQDRACIADEDAGLTVVSLADPQAPVVTGTVDVGRALDVDVATHYACVAAGTGGLAIVDLDDPALPIVSSESMSGSANGIVVDGGRAYIARAYDASGLTVVDISIPGDPRTLITYPTDASVFDVAVAASDSLIYLAEGWRGIEVVQMNTAPFRLRHLGRVETPGMACGLALAQGKLCVADREGGFLVFAPGGPLLTPVGSFSTPGPAVRVHAAGNLVGVGLGTHGFQVFDVGASPESALKTSFDPGGDVWDVVPQGNLVYAANRSLGLQVVRPNADLTPEIAGAFAAAGSVMDVAVAGDLAYLACWRAGLQVVDLSDPLHPISLATLSLPFWAARVVLSGNTAFVLDQDFGLRIIDIRDPRHPVNGGGYTGGFRTPYTPYDLVVRGGLAFIAIGWGVQVVDVSDPVQPRFVVSYDTPGTAVGLALNGNQLYVADRTSLTVIDISDLTDFTPFTYSVAPAAGLASAVTVAGDRAYVSVPPEGVAVFDISNPLHPVQVGACDPDGASAGPIALGGDLAVIPDGGEGLQVLSISDPSNPVAVGSCDTPGAAGRLVLEGDYAFVADGPGGLQVVELYNRRFDVQNNRAESLPVVDCGTPESCYGGGFLIYGIDSLQVGSFRWELSGDDGTTWYQWPNLPYSEWLQLHLLYGNALRWRCFLAPSGPNPRQSPTARLFAITYFPGLPVMAEVRVRDVPDDEGGRVEITWRRDLRDAPVGDAPVHHYEVLTEAPHPGAVDGVDWERLLEVAAEGRPTYTATVPTGADSTSCAPGPPTRFLVRACGLDGTPLPGARPASGSSIDNRAPAQPRGLQGQFEPTTSRLSLAWQANSEPDIEQYRVYRGTGAGFAPHDSCLVGTTRDATLADISCAAAGPSYIKVTAMDRHCNESPAATLEILTTPPPTVELSRLAPNPTAAGFSVTFGVPRDAPVELLLLDVSGRLVRTLASGAFPAGNHTVRVDDPAIPSGLYFCHLRTPLGSTTRRLVIAR